MQKKQMRIWFGGISLVILGIPMLFWIASPFEKAQTEAKEDLLGSQSNGIATPTLMPMPTLVPTPPPGIEEATTDLAAKDAVICGNVRAWVPKERGPADACAVAALKARKPFQLKYNTYTRYNIVDATLIGNRKGYVYFISSTQTCCGDIILYIETYLCKNPIVVTLNGKRRIACKDKRNLTP